MLACPPRMAETRSIRADYTPVACDVCGRTLLRGEQAEPFLAGGTRRQVCELCTPRAQHEGWIREAGMDRLQASAARGEGGIRRGFLGRLRAHRDKSREETSPAAETSAEVRSTPQHELVADSASVAARTPAPVAAPPPAPVAAPPPAPAPASAPASAPDRNPGSRQPRHVRAVPTNADLKRQRALDLFNASPFTRTVSGVARSLGPPDVCVRPLVERPSVVTITVMWELSWYRFEIDLSDEAGGVRRDAHGAELDELDPAERDSNASADPRGALHLQTAG